MYLDIAPPLSAELIQMTRGDDAGQWIMRLAPLLDAAASIMTSFLEARSMALSTFTYRRGKPKDIGMMSTPHSSAAWVMAWIDCCQLMTRNLWVGKGRTREILSGFSELLKSLMPCATYVCLWCKFHQKRCIVRTVTKIIPALIIDPAF